MVILDEADEFIFDSCNTITAPKIVGLTATALDDLEDDAASNYLLQPKYMGFKVLESGIESDITMNSYTEISVEQYVKESIDMAKLIFTSTSGYNRMTELFGK